MGLVLKALADALGAVLQGDDDTVIERVAPLETAGSGDLSFLANRRYAKHLDTTAASAVILAPEDQSLCPVACLVLDNPYLGYARAATLLYPPRSVSAGVHQTAWVSPNAVVPRSAAIGPHAVIEAYARLDEDVVIGAGCVIGEGSAIGSQSTLSANVTVCRDVRIGPRARIHPGVVIGADGFGIANDAGVWVKVPQVGRVVIGADVEIGANTTIDRGALEDTVIGDGVKIDNQVQIGHNVRIGDHTAIAGCVGIAGSARIGARCTIGGGAGSSGHLEIGDDVHLTGATLVHSSITTPGIYSSGMVAQDNASWRKNTARLRRLDEMARRLRALEEQVGSNE